MEISRIHMLILVHLHVNKTNFHIKGFALELVLKQRRKATQKSPIWTGNIHVVLCHFMQIAASFTRTPTVVHSKLETHQETHVRMLVTQVSPVSTGNSTDCTGGFTGL